MAAAIEQAGPGIRRRCRRTGGGRHNQRCVGAGGDRFATSVDAVRREVLAAADLICWELRSPRCAPARAMRTSRCGGPRAGATAPSGDRAAIDLHSQSAARGGRARGAHGFRRSRWSAAENAAAGCAATSACGSSQCPARQTLIHVHGSGRSIAVPSGRSAPRRSRCARYRRGEREGRRCVSARDGLAEVDPPKRCGRHPFTPRAQMLYLAA